MDFEKYTDKSKQVIQAAQALALRHNNQRFLPEHLLASLLDDRERLSEKLIRACGGDAGMVASRAEDAVNAIPKVEGSGAGQLYVLPELARVFDLAEQTAKKSGDEFITVERLLQAL